MKQIEGIIRISTKGVGYVTPPEAARDESILIETADLNTALPSDTVRVAIHPRRGDQATGEVTAVLNRHRLEFVGVLERENGFHYLVPDDRRVYRDFLIDSHRLHRARAGDKVLAKIIDWQNPKKEPRAEVLEVIGAAGQNDTEMRAVAYEQGFRTNFPPAVEVEAKRIKVGAAADLQREIESGTRRDFRCVPTCTIDPADAKDFDDALSLREIENGGLEVGIHIADASHYVQPDTKLDAEASHRATSVYLVDRTIPMLPEILSNDLCSLNEGEDKLTFSAVFTFDRHYHLRSEWFGQTVIHSDKRFIYEEAQRVLDEKRGPLTAELLTLNKIAHHLRAKKQAAGAINFEQPEIKFVLDKRGRPLRIIKKTRTDIHLLVEDLMLLANRRVAEFVSRAVGNRANHFVYRVHDKPDIDKLKNLANFLAPLGYRLKFGPDGVLAKDLNALLRHAAGRPEEAMIQTAMMRSMAKAVYTTKNIGHYGLAFGHYAHFTSPIRRYPDIMAHRLLAYYLERKRPPEKMLRRADQLALHASERELDAQEAERASVRYKQVEYWSARAGQICRGVISGLTKWGLYVQEVETLAEGLVRLADLDDDYYIFDEKNYAMVGKNTGRRFRLGDAVKVKIARADLQEKQIDFEFV